MVGRPVGAAQGFNYSAALAGLGGEWTVERLSRFIENPRGYAPGTTMAFAGLRDRTARINLIAYINAQGN